MGAVKVATGLTLGTALVAPGCVGGNVSTAPKIEKPFEISTERAGQLRKLPGYQLSDIEICQLAAQNYGSHKTNTSDFARANIQSTFDNGDESVTPCYINRTNRGSHQTDVIFSAQKLGGVKVNYFFDKTNNRVDKVTVIDKKGNFEMATSFYPDNTVAMELAETKVNGYLSQIEAEIASGVKKSESRKQELLNHLK